MFGQLLIAIYQDDIVEEDDIRRWHALPASKGQGLTSDVELENYKKCWLIGARMIHQLDEQESDSDEDEGESEDSDSDDEDANEDANEDEHNINDMYYTNY